MSKALPEIAGISSLLTIVSGIKCNMAALIALSERKHVSYGGG